MELPFDNVKEFATEPDVVQGHRVMANCYGAADSYVVCKTKDGYSADKVAKTLNRTLELFNEVKTTLDWFGVK